jgi:hypothetical protein
MKKIVIVSCLLVFTGLYASSQPWKKGGGGAAPASATPTAAGASGAAGATTPATSGTSQTGYVYRLKAGKHVQYASLKTETHYFLRASLTDDSILGLPVQSGKLITATIILDRKANPALLQSGIRSFQEYDIRSIVKQVTCKAAATGSCPAPTPKDSTALQGLVTAQASNAGDSAAIATPDTALAVTILYYDSLPRFTNDVLQLFITQDTAILQAKIENRKFDINVKTDQYPITNRNYQSQFETGKKARRKRERSQQKILMQAYEQNLSLTRDFKVDLATIGPIKAVEKLFLSPDTTRGKNDSSQIQPAKKPSYPELLKSYRTALKQYKKDEFSAAMKNFSDPDSNKLFIREYDSVATKYLSALNEYWVMTLPLRESNDTARLDILDPELVADTVKNELKFIKGLYQLYTQPQPPDTIPYDIGDKNIPETAITMTNGDSINNFYFNILNKSVVNQPLYFGKFRYSTWDFGTSTVPFRYRFGQPKAHVITQAGVDTSVQAGTSESDASISLSLYIGRKWGRTRFYQNPALTTNTIAIEPVLLTGPTLIALSLSNIDSSSRYANYKRNYSYSGPSNIIAWSFGTGCSIQYKTVSAGLFIGLDAPLTGHTGWIYADKFWIGFGIGVNLGMLTSGNSVN